jgi:hypothetical protein
MVPLLNHLLFDTLFSNWRKYALLNYWLTVEYDISINLYLVTPRARKVSQQLLLYQLKGKKFIAKGDFPHF